VSLETRWAELVRNLAAKQKAILDYRLFESGRLQKERVAEFQRLQAECDDAKDKMDKFISSALGGLKPP
jgi:hypothetical protein